MGMLATETTVMLMETQIVGLVTMATLMETTTVNLDTMVISMAMATLGTETMAMAMEMGTPEVVTMETEMVMEMEENTVNYCTFGLFNFQGMLVPKHCAIDFVHCSFFV